MDKTVKDQIKGGIIGGFIVGVLIFWGYEHYRIGRITAEIREELSPERMEAMERALANHKEVLEAILGGSARPNPPKGWGDPVRMLPPGTEPKPAIKGEGNAN